MVDYIVGNPLEGHVEYRVPGSSGTGSGNAGYADIANTFTAEMFEIKPNNPTAVAAGSSEVELYVDKANLNCPPTASLSPAWRKGFNYSTRYLQGKDPLTYLQAILVEPGVIGYKYVAKNSLPSPAPVVISQDVLDKIGRLVTRLKGHLDKADGIIATFIRENPGFAAQIQAAGIGVGIGIIIGTIIEDFTTLGTGIADDWASFVLAYRIIRFCL
jgi:hypothetical protein